MKQNQTTEVTIQRELDPAQEIVQIQSNLSNLSPEQRQELYQQVAAKLDERIQKNLEDIKTAQGDLAQKNFGANRLSEQVKNQVQINQVLLAGAFAENPQNQAQVKDLENLEHKQRELLAGQAALEQIKQEGNLFAAARLFDMNGDLRSGSQAQSSEITRNKFEPSAELKALRQSNPQEYLQQYRKAFGTHIKAQQKQFNSSLKTSLAERTEAVNLNERYQAQAQAQGLVSPLSQDFAFHDQLTQLINQGENSKALALLDQKHNSLNPQSAHAPRLQAETLLSKELAKTNQEQFAETKRESQAKLSLNKARLKKLDQKSQAQTTEYIQKRAELVDEIAALEERKKNESSKDTTTVNTVGQLGEGFSERIIVPPAISKALAAKNTELTKLDTAMQESVEHKEELRHKLLEETKTLAIRQDMASRFEASGDTATANKILKGEASSQKIDSGQVVDLNNLIYKDKYPELAPEERKAHIYNDTLISLIEERQVTIKKLTREQEQTKIELDDPSLSNEERATKQQEYIDKAILLEQTTMGADGFVQMQRQVSEMVDAGNFSDVVELAEGKRTVQTEQKINHPNLAETVLAAEPRYTDKAIQEKHLPEARASAKRVSESLARLETMLEKHLASSKDESEALAKVERVLLTTAAWDPTNISTLRYIAAKIANGPVHAEAERSEEMNQSALQHLRSIRSSFENQVAETDASLWKGDKREAHKGFKEALEFVQREKSDLNNKISQHYRTEQGRAEQEINDRFNAIKDTLVSGSTMYLGPAGIPIGAAIGYGMDIADKYYDRGDMQQAVAFANSRAGTNLKSSTMGALGKVFARGGGVLASKILPGVQKAAGTGVRAQRLAALRNLIHKTGQGAAGGTSGTLPGVIDDLNTKILQRRSLIDQWEKDNPNISEKEINERLKTEQLDYQSLARSTAIQLGGGFLGGATGAGADGISNGLKHIGQKITLRAGEALVDLSLGTMETLAEKGVDPYSSDFTTKLITNTIQMSQSGMHGRFAVDTAGQSQQKTKPSQEPLRQTSNSSAAATAKETATSDKTSSNKRSISRSTQASSRRQIAEEIIKTIEAGSVDDAAELRADLSMHNDPESVIAYARSTESLKSKLIELEIKATMTKAEQKAATKNDSITVETSTSLPEGVQAQTEITVHPDGTREAKVKFAPGIEEAAKNGNRKALEIYLEEINRHSSARIIDPRGMSQEEYTARRAFEELGAESEAKQEAAKLTGAKVDLREDGVYKSAMAKLKAATSGEAATRQARSQAALNEIQNDANLRPSSNPFDPMITEADLANYNRDYARNINGAEGEPLSQVSASSKSPKLTDAQQAKPDILDRALAKDFSKEQHDYSESVEQIILNSPPDKVFGRITEARSQSGLTAETARSALANGLYRVAENRNADNLALAAAAGYAKQHGITEQFNQHLLERVASEIHETKTISPELRSIAARQGLEQEAQRILENVQKGSEYQRQIEEPIVRKLEEAKPTKEDEAPVDRRKLDQTPKTDLKTLHAELNDRTGNLKVEDIEAMLPKDLDPAEREIALQALSVLSQQGNIDGLRAFADGLRQKVQEGYTFLDLQPNSITSVLQYLDSKSSLGKEHKFSKGKQGVKPSERNAVILDQPTIEFLKANKGAVADLKRLGVEFIAPPFGWDNGINSFNPNAKLDLTRIVETTKEAEESGLTREAALQQTLETDFIEAIEELGIRNYTRVDSLNINDVSPESIAKNLNIKEISQEGLAKSLSHLSPEERELAMQYIQQELSFIDPRTMDSMIDQVYGDLIAQTQGIDPSQIYFYVPAPKPSARRDGTLNRLSPKIIANALAQKYNIPADRFIFPPHFQGSQTTRTQIRELRNDGKLRMLAFIDDFSGSGKTSKEIYKQMRDVSINLPVYVGSLVSGETGLKRSQRLHDRDQIYLKQQDQDKLKLNPAEGLLTGTATTIKPYKDTEFYKNLSPYQQALFGKIIGKGGIFSSDGYGLLFFYSSPNNNNRLITEHIAPLFGLGDKAARTDNTRR